MISTTKLNVKAAAKRPRTWLYLTAYGVGITTLAVPEALAVKSGGDNTISAWTRKLFHTDTRTGRTVWLACIGVFGALFAGHIMGTEETLWELPAEHLKVRDDLAER